MWLAKVVFGSTSFTWTSKILCPLASCSQERSTAVESLDSSVIYSFVYYGVPYIIFMTLNSTNGSVVGSRYISNIAGSALHKSAIFSNYVISIFYDTTAGMILFNISTGEITWYQLSNQIPQSFVLEPLHGRIVMGGVYNSKVFYSKFYLVSSPAYSDLLSPSLSITTLSSGSYSVISAGGISFNSATTPTVTTGSYSNLTVTYLLDSGSSMTSDVLFQIGSQSYLTLIENTYIEISPDLTCSSSGSTSISYSIGSYNGASIPSWVSIDSLGALKITSPSISSATNYSFYINSFVSGATGNAQKLITIQVNK